ncbi:MAG TPA: replicative DNA helicase [Thermodesulfobacteriota bacterium]|nr:replicative DNA helicase [Deltaproteobacteria bacterium]HNR11722.1 replicative DNA helicase [Thermodesulfobacteriota bacterium]
MNKTKIERAEKKEETSFLTRIPPQNLEAEQAVLGAILLDNDVFHQVIELLQVEDFYREAHRKIYSSMIDLYNRNEPVDLITLTETITQKDRLDAVGGPAYLSSLVDSIPTSANVLYYSKIVREKSILRKTIGAATEIVTRGYETKDDVEGLLDFAENSIFQISDYQIKPSFYPLRAIIKDTFKTIEKLFEKRELITGVPSGFEDLDQLTSGFQSSDLIIIAGRPSMGKTSFALNIAQHAAIKKNIPVAVFSLEMSKEQIVIRMLCSEAKIDAHKLRGGFLSESDWPKLTRAAGTLSEAPIFIDDTAGTSVLEMRAKARRLKRDQGLGMIVVDYLQLMRDKSVSDSREQEISSISRSLKALAKELNLPVIALSQLNRRVEDRQDKRPQLADLRESGAIEQDADVILFVYREEVYHKDDAEKKGKAEIIVGKQRNGPVGLVPLAFIDKYATFESYAYGRGDV